MQTLAQTVADSVAADTVVHGHRARNVRPKSHLSTSTRERVRMRRSSGACVTQSGTRGSPPVFINEIHICMCVYVCMHVWMFV